MSLVQLTLLAALGLVLAFWIVGAAARVKKLRQAITTAWGHLDELLARRAAALDTMLAYLQQPLAAEVGSLQAVALAHAVQMDAARAVRAHPGAREAALAWVTAEAALASPMVRLLALLEQNPQTVSQADVRPQVRLLHDHVVRIAYARQVVNDAVTAHNAAIDELPTRWLARVFGWERAAAV